MTAGGIAPATLPPRGLAGLDPDWSRLVTVPGLDGVGRTFHVLDNRVADPAVTLLCVHGNPSWSYLWRRLLAAAGPGIRVVAPDHLDMGFSERTGSVRRLRRRIDDLGALGDALDLGERVITVGHDWGGPISLGWAERHRDRLAGIVLANTAVHQPAGSPAPRIIRVARTRAVLRPATVATGAFVRGAIAMSRPDADVEAAYLAPYGSAERRAAVATFVEDIPLEPDHPSATTLDEVAAGLADLRDVPALLLWGPDDPVFSDLYLHDLEARLPHAAVHRFAGVRHYVPEEPEAATAVLSWAAGPTPPVVTRDDAPNPPLWSAIEQRRGDPEVAVREMTAAGSGRSVSFAALATDVERIAAGLHALGVRPGDRVALLVTPGIDLAALLYGCWRLGAVVVIADAGLGARGIGGALTSAAPDVLVGVTRALAAARVLRWPGRRIAVGSIPEPLRLALGVEATLEDVRRLGASSPAAPAGPGPDDPAAIAFTSGATGPAKGVRYRHRQGRAQVEALVSLYDITPDDRLVAAFAPFALYGPAMGIASVVPDMDLTAPGSLRALALAEAVMAVDATVVFASPAALRNVAATAVELGPRHRSALAGVRLLTSAGAPVAPAVLADAVALMPNAEAHTPYGMTEALPIADISLSGIAEAGEGNGVCVGVPLPGVDVLVDPLDATARPTGAAAADPGVTGEVLVRAAHMRDGYDRLWLTEHLASQPAGWHRTGDVGHLDDEGRLWIEGRLVHVVASPSGPVTPVSIEHAVETLPGVRLAAVVGVGPPGTQQVVVVVEPTVSPDRPRLAPGPLAGEVRDVAGVEVAAVLAVPAVPVDVRHNSKVDRSRLARWATGVLAGQRMGRP